MKDQKISKNRQKKEALVAELTEKVEKAKAIVFTNYQGMTHKQLEVLKKGLKAAEAELIVAKNTLLTLALQGKSGKGKGESQNETEKKDTSLPLNALPFPLDGPTATLFAYNDVVLPLKEIAKSIKNLKLPVVKFGILEGKAITGNQVLTLSTLPSREVLIAQVVGGMKSPLFGLHRALSWNLQKFVMTLSAIQQKKS